MRIIVTHTSPDLDAISSVWVIKRFLPGWENAAVKHVPAGDRINLSSEKISPEDYTEEIEKIGRDEVIHVDTGLGPLDHHQIPSDKICGASLAWDFVKAQVNIKKEKEEAVDRMMKIIVDIDHFKEALRADALDDYHEFELYGLLEGLKYQFPGDDSLYADFIMKCLDAILHNFENRIWAEKELAENSLKFKTKFGEALAIETLNDTALKLAQKMKYDLVVKKDPKWGFVRIKARPDSKIDLTSVYDILRKKDPQATWFLHIGKKMLLNGTTKNPKMIPTKLTLPEVIEAVKQAYST